MGSRLVPRFNSGEDVQTGGRRSSNPYTMTPEQVFTAVRGDPPPAPTLRQLLLTPEAPSHADTFQGGFNPGAESPMWGGQAPVDPIPENPQPQYSQLDFMRSGAEIQGPTTSRASGGKVQTPTSPQVPCQSGYCQYRVCDDTSSTTEDDVQSLSYSPTTPEPPPQPVPRQRNSRGQLIGPAPVQPLHAHARQRLLDEYDIVPDFIEANLWLLPDGKATTDEHREIEAVLRTQLNPVAQGPYRMLMRSFPLALRAKLRRIRRDTYAIRKGENQTLSRLHEQRSTKELLKLRVQLREMTEARDALLQEVEMLRKTNSELCVPCSPISP
ncbi:hypothetical protein ABVT39_011297 [Epinephelus coioides]